jgi:hypothetical protein
MIDKEAELEKISLDKEIDISLNRNNKEIGGIMGLEHYTVTYSGLFQKMSGWLYY